MNINTFESLFIGFISLTLKKKLIPCSLNTVQFNPVPDRVSGIRISLLLFLNHFYTLLQVIDVVHFFNVLSY